jgi:hypothetical protein
VPAAALAISANRTRVACETATRRQRGCLDGGGHPSGLPSRLTGETREFETRAAWGQVGENDLPGADRGGLSL